MEDDVKFDDLRDSTEEIVEKKYFKEIPTFIISAIITFISLILLPIYTKFYKISSKSGKSNINAPLVMFYYILYIGMFIFEILVPIRLYIRDIKEEKKKFTNLTRGTLFACFISLFVIVFLLILYTLMIF